MRRSSFHKSFPPIISRLVQAIRPVSTRISHALLNAARRKIVLSRVSRRGESSAFLLNPRLVKSTSFIKKAGSTVATLRAGAPYYLLIEKARAIHMPYAFACTLAAREWIIMNTICALKEPSAPRPLRRAAQAPSRRLCEIAN